MSLDLKYVVDFVIHRLVGDGLTHLKLQKILYYIQAWHLSIYQEPIIDEDFEAWIHGPVCRKVFDRFKNQKGLYTLFSKDDVELSEELVEEYFEIFPEERKHILEVIEVYGAYTGNQLEELTHQETPWINARNGMANNTHCSHIIPKRDMQEYYKPL